MTSPSRVTKWGFWGDDAAWAAAAASSYASYLTACEVTGEGALTGGDGAARRGIPHICHHIYLGGPLPKRFVRLRETWMTLHPDWAHWLWTDAEVAKLPLFNRVRFSPFALSLPSFFTASVFAGAFPGCTQPRGAV